MVAKLDRLSRSLLDFAGLMAKAQQQGWGVIALDVQVDTSTASGEAMANMLATFAQFERRLIGQRTKEALAVKKASGVGLGRPPLVPRSVVRRMQRQRARGETLRAIAESLNRDEVPTASRESGPLVDCSLTSGRPGREVLSPEGCGLGQTV